jgi:hypothetical protein
VALVYVVNHVKDFVMLYLTTFCNLCLFSLLLLCLMNNVNIFGLLRVVLQIFACDHAVGFYFIHC